MAKRRKASKARKASRTRAAKPKEMYMCAHCGYKSSKGGMHCGTECAKC